MSPTVSPDLQRRLEALYAAFNSRDIPALLAAMTSDVVWPNGWEGGVVRGRDAVRAYWTRQWSQIDPSVIPTAFQPEPDGRVAVTVHQVVRTSEGAVVADGHVTHVFLLRDDLIQEMEIRE